MKENPAQLTFAAVFPPIITAVGDGYTVRPGKPLIKLTATQLAAHFSVDRDTVYRWRQEGLIPAEYVCFAGKRRLMFLASVIPRLENHFSTCHDE